METNEQKIVSEITQILKGHGGFAADNPLVISAMVFAVNQLLSTQEEKIFKQLETIDIKMGDSDAEAKIKFAIKAMVRHIKLKNATK